jgi:aspartyl-tRNA(Asn)/glutamyl-tRNA(Gln) amidotransferase subunit A
LRGKEQDAADYIDLLHARASFIETVGNIFNTYDIVLMPTVPIIAPTIASLDKDEDYVRTNALVLRNPSIINFLDGCAISIPCNEAGNAPVGMMLCGVGGADRKLLAAATAVERALA